MSTTAIRRAARAALAALVVATAPAAAGIDPPVRSIPGFNYPGPVVRDGDLLYVGQNEAPYGIQVVDISTPGAEFITDSLFTAMSPIDLAITPGGVIYIVDHTNQWMDRRSAAGLWTSIPLANGGSTNFNYGEKLFIVDDRLLVLQHNEGLIDVFDPESGHYQTTITVTPGVDCLRVTEDRIVLLGTNDCANEGPYFSVHQRSDLSLLYQVDLDFECPEKIVVEGGRIHVIFRLGARIDTYDLDTGAFLDTLALPFLSRYAAFNGAEFIVQQYSPDIEGRVLTLDAAVDTVIDEFDVLEGSPIWFPPYLEMVAMPRAGDGRVFMSNINDDTLTIIDLPCQNDVDGSGDVDFGDVLAILSAWGPCAGCPEDLDGSGMVDFGDLLLVLAGYGGCS